MDREIGKRVKERGGEVARQRDRFIKYRG